LAALDSSLQCAGEVIPIHCSDGSRGELRRLKRQTLYRDIVRPKRFVEEEEAAVMQMAAKSPSEMFGLGYGQSMRAEDTKHRSSKSAFACTFVALEDEYSLANLAGVLKSVPIGAFLSLTLMQQLGLRRTHPSLAGDSGLNG
jgi:hypothetical protein